MTAIDTNVLVRLLTGDDQAQFTKAQALIQGNLVLIPETVLLECEWVLRYTYGFSRTQIQGALTGVLGLEPVKVSCPQVVYDALSWFLDGMDFADALHWAGCGHCDTLATFDRAFMKSAKRCSPYSVLLL